MNPELQRNIWLELSPLRILMMPPLLALVFLLAVLLNESNDQLVEILTWTAATLLGLFTVWGASRAFNSIDEEIKERTWDFQKMSPMSAWSMTWGKLLGSTIYAWYGAGICLVVFVLSGLQLSTPYYVFSAMYLYLAGSIGFHALCILSAIDSHSQRRDSSSDASGFKIILMMASLCFLIPVFKVFKTIFYGNSSPLLWHGTELAGIPFLLVWATVFSVWFVFGAYRVMRSELMYEVAPRAWIAFLVLVVIFISGFDSVFSSEYTSGVGYILLVASAVALSGTYIMLLRERIDVVSLRRLFRSIPTSDFWLLRTNMPRWFASLVFCLTVATVHYGLYFFSFFKSSERAALLSALPLIVCLMAIRDLIVLMLIRISEARKGRHFFWFFVSFILLYVLFPLILAQISDGALLQLFFPWLATSAVTGLTIALLWSGVSLTSFVVYWRARQ